MADRLTILALEAVGRYTRLLDTLRNQYHAGVRSDPTRGDTMTEVRATATDAAARFVQREVERLQIDTSMVALHALRDAYSEVEGQAPDELPAVLIDHIEATGGCLGQALAAQVERDLATVLKELRVAAIRVEMNVEAGSPSRQTALLQVQMDSRQAPSFRFIDRIGRKYNSTKHIRDQYRLHLLTTYNEVYLHTLASFGYEEAQVWHPDPGSVAHGQILSITSGGHYPSYYEVQDELFHPTSSALVRLSVED